MEFIIKKPFNLARISDESRKLLKLKEKDFMILVSSSKYTKTQIMRKLYITDYCNYWRLKKRVEKTLQKDIAIRNNRIKKAFQSLKNN